MIIACLIVAVIVIAAIFLLYKKNAEEKRAEEERLRKIAEEEERQRQIALEIEAKKAARKAEIEAGKELYHYLNQSIKTMFYHYRTEQWDTMESLGTMELKDCEAALRCIEKLSSGSKTLVKRFYSCLDFEQNLEGEGKVIDAESLKSVFEDVMLPFFPLYYKEFSNGPRYISFLNQQILKVFTQLSGKKFRLGYKNRYQNGQIAFEWTDHVYRVFDMNGKKLCEASFENKAVKDGYVIVKDDATGDDLWKVYKKETFKDGVLIDEDIHYMYTRSI
ncbi:MAG: hypothetical protein Q4E53_01720 [Eubacteriales bacterium]|nr:hypothetical protein [Eubacteriales bacterium]